MALILLTALVYVVFDMGIIATPLGSCNHWIPELFVLICFGYYMNKRYDGLLVKTVGFCIMLYTLLTYALLSLTWFGVFASGFFSASFLVGVLYSKIR